ncbi:MAG: ribonuclease R [Alphaproteobacteria bacterium]|nr:ribonuclease R [Alphaproteobacteria bacterium]MBP9776985.1 ribonuclease R [Alphaproteobacteria bacterium]
MVKKGKHLPTSQDILEFIQSSSTKVGKREIARAFNLRGQDRLWLKDLLKNMGEEGLIERGHQRKLHSQTHLPSVLLVNVSAELSEEGEVLLTPVEPHKNTSPILLTDKGAARVNPGDRLLVRVKLHKNGHYIAHLLKKLVKKSATLVGAIIKSRGKLYVQPCDRRRQEDLSLLDPQESGHEGELVLAELSQHLRTKQAKIIKKLGTLNDPRVISLISIYQEGIPHEFSQEALNEAEHVRTLPLEGREDLRSIPFVTIDGEDARDFDDAVWATHDPVKGWHLMVAIADVSHYVKPGSALDKEAYLRGNSIYFPDRVVPMLPEALSNDLCSLRPKEDKACFAVHLWLDTKGRLKHYQFVRGILQSVARLTYTQVQKAIDGNPDDQTIPLLDPVLRPLYGAYALLKKAREFRGTLDLDLPEKQVILDKAGHIQDIHPRPRFDSHRLIEEFMILANVAAAQQLEALKAPCIYRIHDVPNPEKILMFQEFIEGLGFSFPKSQAITPRSFLHLLKAAQNTPHQELINQLTLRTQAQALYHPDNIGHFGLSLKKYSHFTSPIRRYADIIVHRSLVAALKLGEDGLPKDIDLNSIGEQVSFTERRAAAAERASLERYVTVYLKDKVGETFEGRINGVTSFGLFVTLKDSGADGLIPMSYLPEDFYHYEEKKHCLIGRRHRRVYTLGDSLSVILKEVDTFTNSITLAPTGSSSAKRKKRSSK